MQHSLAFVFPGQGSQSVGMLHELSLQSSIVQATFAEASQALGYDLWELVSRGPAEQLNQTEYTQPAVLTVDIAVWRMWLEASGARPSVLAGHSLGEYAALVCAEVFSFSDAVRLVAERGRLMQSAVPAGTGGMAAIIGLDLAGVTALCEHAAEGEVLTPANLNATGQIVIAGTANAVTRAVAAAKQFGAKLAKPLPVSVPSHCLLMKPAALQLEIFLEKIPLSSPTIPVIHNVDVSVHTEPAEIRHALIHQLYMPVRWIETIEQFEKQGVQRIIECGPGNILAGLNKRIVASIPTDSIGEPTAFHACVEQQEAY